MANTGRLKWPTKDRENVAMVQLLRVYYCKFMFLLGGKILPNGRFV